ncbi:alpha-L RNA-binding motif-containing protein [Fomitiporia mediterranea MF3/22]|uniref:alpha-L RNA-binding motif-containing protein n=1 Tax=Fomitiporia mediterranea (strain MF3/22) TaxID=694068 RepID=UPI00044078AE|nr:alpha-L RNA-binding motif-containing protein [Fomitiporia mediterranea MF3/22]EJD07890.1 alpha-L RNA-binding motif-containing protein [Fomitiporia mediterranea MF3/22]
MRDKNVFGIRKALPRMSWSPRNLYNLYRRSLTELRDDTVFTSSGNSLFQQRWKAKRLTRAYHGDFINEKIFKRWYLPSTLPDVRPHSRRAIGDDAEPLNKWAVRTNQAVKEKEQREEEELLAQAPVASLMFEEVERRIDVFIFRCCFAHSVYEARRMVIHGDVLLNGKKHTNANTRIAPGDMVSVDPEAISFLRKPEETKNSDGEENEAEAAPDSESNSTSKNQPSDISAGEESSESGLTPFHLPPFAAPFIFIPAYIEVNFATCSAIFVRRPTARFSYSEIPSPYEADGEIMRLTWEWYNKVRPRMRSKSQLARMPDNRKETRVIPGIGLHPSKNAPLPTGTSLNAQIARNSVY